MAIPHLSQVSISTPAGTPPLVVTSSDLVSNLNAQYLNGQLGGYYQDAGNLNAGTLLAARLPAFTGDVSSTVGTVGLSLASVGTAGTYRSVTTDAKGRVTAGTNPTTLAGYGITDALNTSATAQTKSGNLYITGTIAAFNYVMHAGAQFNSLYSDDLVAMAYQKDVVQDLFAFNAPTSYEVYNGTAWVSGGSVPTALFDGKQSTNFTGGITFGHNSYSQVRFTWNSFGYKYWSSLVSSFVATNNSFRYRLQWSTDNITYTDFYVTAYMGGWPGYNTYYNSQNNSGKTPYLRLIIEFSWNLNPAYSFYPIYIGNIGLMGSYGGFTRLFDWDYNRNIFLGGGLTGSTASFSGQITSTVVVGTAPLVVTSTTLVSNLNSQLLNGQLGGWYQDAANLNAGTLLAARLPAFTGDVSSTVGTVGLTLANSGATAGTYTKVTVDVKGRVTAGAALASADLPTYTGTITGSQVTTGLGFTPYNASNPNNYITASALTGYLPLAGGTMTGELVIATGASSGVRVNSPSGTQGFWLRVGYDTDGTATPVVSLLNTTFQSSGSSSGTFSFACGNAKAVSISASALNSLVALQQGGNQVLHSANVATYALPIGGGTLTGNVTAPRFISSQASGTAPFDVTSTTVVANLNADLLDGQQGSYYQDAGNLNAGTLLAARLPNSGTLAGTYTKVTVNLKGIVTAGQSLQSADLPVYTGTITSSQVTTGLGFTPYNATNPSNYITTSGSTTGKSGGVSVSDTRSTTTTPQTINSGVVFDFKEYAVEGMINEGSYFGEMTFRPYGSGTDWSGTLSHQLGFTDYGNIYQRSGSNTTWDAWKKILNSSNYTSYALPLAGGTLTGNLTITKSSAYLFLNGTNSDAEIYWQANGTSRWAMGMNVGDNTENLNIYNYTTASTNFTILKASGNVGINQATPSYKLDVTGTGRFTGDLTANLIGNAATATNVAWSGITSKPTNLSGFGITDALPLTGGTLTGALNGTSAGFSSTVAATGQISANGGLSISGGLYQGAYTRRQIVLNGPGTAAFGNWKQFIRLWAVTGSGGNTFTLKVSVRGTWNYTPVFGTVEACYALYLPADGTIASVRDFKIVHVSGPATDNIRLGDAVIENGYASIPLWCANTNGLEATVEQWTGSQILGTVTTAVSEALPAFIAPDFRGGLKSDGNTVLHAGNYTSYPDATKLPLAGGTLTGKLTVNSTGAWNDAQALVTIGSADGRLQVRHIWGKSGADNTVDHLWLNYTTNTHVQIGSTGGTNNLYVAGNIYAGGYFAGNLVLSAGNYGAYSAFSGAVSGASLSISGTSSLNRINLNAATNAIIQYRAPGQGTSTLNLPFYNNATNGSINIEMADNDTGGIVIDNEGVTVYGAGDNGEVFRVIDEDVYQSNSNITLSRTFWINQGLNGGGGILGQFTISGNVAIHAGNYTSYGDATKLPLAGGTLTGNLSLNTGVIFNRGSAPSITNIQCSIFNELNGIGNAESLNSRAYAGFKWQYWDGSVTWMQLTSAGLTINGNNTLHAGNYNSYALPLAGGTMTGSIQLPVGGSIGLNGGTTYGIGVAGHSGSAVFDTVDSTGSDPLELNYYNGGPVKIGSGANGSKSLYAVGIYDNGNAVLTSASTSAPSLSIGGSSATCTGAAAAVPWSGITSKPTTLSGFGITDAMYQSNPNGFTQGDIYGSGNHQRLWGTDSVQNLLAFRPPTTVEYTTDNVNWVATSISNNVFDNKVFGKWGGFNMNAGTNVGGWTKVRMTWVNFGYHFFSHFTLCHSTNGHSMNFVFYKSDLNGVFSSESYRVNGISSWPGYTFAAHNNVSGWWDTRDVRMVFELNGNNGPSGTPQYPISIGHIGIMGGYSSFNRLFEWDGNRNIDMYGNLSVAAGTVTALNFSGPGTSLTGTASNLVAGSANAIADGVVSTSAKISNSVVTLAKIANISTGTILGNDGVSAGAPIALTTAQIAAMLSGQVNASQLNGQAASYYQNAGNLNAGTLLAARLPAFTGDVTSTAGAVGLTLASIATAGTYNEVTIDAKGRVTAGTNVPVFYSTGGTITGSLVAQGGTNSVLGSDSGTANQWYGRVGSVNGTSNRYVFVGTYGSFGAIRCQVNSTGADADLYINTVDGSAGGTVRMPSTVLINGSQAIHAGNLTSYVNTTSYFENRDTTAVGISAGTLTLTRANGNMTTTLGGRVVAWVEFDGNMASTTNGNGNFNVSSVTKNATGDYTINFSSSLANANYVVAGTAQMDTTSGWTNNNLYVGVARRSGAKSTSSCRIGTEFPSNQSLYNSGSVGIAFIAA